MKVTVKFTTITHSLMTRIFPEEEEKRFSTKREATEFILDMKRRCDDYGFIFVYDIVKG